MANTPVTIEFNAVGTQETIAQIKAITEASGLGMQSAKQLAGVLQSHYAQAGETAKQYFEATRKNAKDFEQEIQSLSFKMFIWQMTFQQLQGIAQGFYNVALKGNEDLRQSILSTESSLVAVADVYKDGIKIEDSTDAIQALGPAIEKAIKGIRKDSLDLVGVTSEQLIPLFQILSNNAGKIANQSKEWADPIEAAQKLTISFAAGLGTLGIPIRQARQEIQSMLQGYIDQNSLMAKQLGITNDQVRLWQKQGVLVDELVNRLQPLVDGNKLAAQSISGIGSNILEVIQEIQRVGTEPLYEPVVNQLKGVYEWLKKNQEFLAQGVISVVEFLTGLAERLAEAFGTAFELMSPFREQLDNIGQTIGNLTGELLKGFVDALSSAAIAIGALLNALNPLLMAFNAIMTVMNDLGVTRVVAFTAAIGLMINAVSGLVGQGIKLISFIVNLAAPLYTLLNTTVTVNGAFAGFSATTAILTSSLGALGNTIVAVTAKMGAMLVAAGPLILALAALGTGWAAIEGKKLDKINQAMDDYFVENEKTMQDALNAKLSYQKAYQDAVKGDGVITDAEQKILQDKRKAMEAYKPLMEMRIKELKELRAMTGNEDQQRGIDLMVKNLEDMINGIGEDGIATKLKGIKSLGDAYKYLSEESVNALKNLKENQYSDKAEADRDSKTLINNTKQEIEFGIISLEEARKRYAELANLSYLDAATRIAAEKELTTIIKLEGDRRKEIIEKNQQEIQQKIYQNRLSQITGEKELTEAKIKSAEAQLETTRKLIAQQEAIAASHGMTGMSEEKRKLLLEQEKVETEIAKLRREKVEQENKALLTDYDESIALLTKFKEQKLVGEVDYYRQLDVIQTTKLDEQIRQTKEKLKDLAKTDKEGREALLAQIAEFEGKKAKLLSDGRERERKILVTDYDEANAILTMNREKRLIGEEDFYQRSKAIAVGKYDEEIRQAREKLDDLAETDKEGREALIAQIAELETKKAKLINDADQRLLNQRIQAIRLATELLKLETERTNQVLTELSMGLSDENRQLELSNKALDTKKSLVETLMAVEKSYQELTKTSQSIELSRAERALDYFTKLNDEKIRGTILEKVYRDELQAIDKHGLTQKQLFEDRQEAEAKLFNTKLTNLLREQEIQKQLLELDLLREQSQLNQAVNQEKINVLKAQQAANEAQAKTAEAEGKVREATLVYQNAIAQGKTPQEIEEARIGLERARLSLESSRVNEVYSQRAIGYSQDALILAEGGLSRFDQLAQLRRELLRNQQNNAIQNINYEGEQLGAKQRIEKGTFLMENPDYGTSVITPTINRAGYTRYGIPVPDDRYEVEPTGDRRLDGLFQGSQRDYRSRVTPSEADLINAETDRRLEIFNPPKPRKDLKEWTARGWDVSLSPEELEEIKRQKTGNIVFFNPTTAPDYPKGDSPDAQGLTPIPLEDFISKESGLPSPDILQTLLPQFNDQVIPNQINQIIGLISELKGGLAAIAEAKPLVNPTINNNFVGAIESGDTMAAYRKETLRIIDSVIPKM